MRPSGAVSGTALGVISVGGLLIYAGFMGVNPIQALALVASGHPTSPTSKPADIAADVTERESTEPEATGGENVSGLRGAVVSASGKYVNDKYSQAKRTQAGWSDCSSFVDKCLKDAGIAPPQSPWASTANYRASGAWKNIAKSAAQPGDIAISSHHMILITQGGGNFGIGQETEGVNVKTGTPAQLFGKQTYVFKTWTGYATPTGQTPGQESPSK